MKAISLADGMVAKSRRWRTAVRLHHLQVARPAEPRSAPVAGGLAGRGDAVGGADHHHGEGVGLVELCRDARSEEHTSELQSLMRISYAVFCLKNKIITS